MDQAAERTAKVIIGATSFGSSFFSPDMRWLTQYNAPDPFIAAIINGKTLLFVGDLEFERVKKQAAADEVILITRYIKENGLEKDASDIDVVKHFLLARDVIHIELEPFLHSALELANDFAVEPKKMQFFPARTYKTPEEIHAISKIGLVTEGVINKVFSSVADMSILNGKIYDKSCRIMPEAGYLTAEGVRAFMNLEFVAHGCFCPDAIIASGDQAVDPHQIGTGPLLAHVPIVFDIFPRSTENLYWYDTTRTIVKGKATREAKKLYLHVKDAQELGLGRIRHGADGSEIHKEIQSFLQRKGFQTGIQKAVIDGKEEMKMQGFFHGTGHGVGVDIHEYPRINSKGSILHSQMVVTVEPGLYYYGIGGVRIEDTVVVMPSGHENLSHLTKELLEL